MTGYSAETELILQALSEPALIVEVGGPIVFANQAALARLGASANSRLNLSDFCPSPAAAAALRAYLGRCSGSRSPQPGAIDLRGADGHTARLRCQASLLSATEEGHPARLMLRLFALGSDHLPALAQKVRDLNEEVRKRRRTQLLLEASLRDRELLLRELHHRVKNNIHMLIGMLSMARREATAPETRSVLEDAQQRLAAVGTVHQMLYHGDSLHGVHGSEFVPRIAGMVMDGVGARDRLSLAVQPIEIPNDTAVPLALILNELLTNAVKHGKREDGVPGQIRLHCGVADAMIEMSIEDEGPGFEAALKVGRRASGLGLVRGLTRQIGGSFSVHPGSGRGARCVVRFPDRRAVTGTKETSGAHASN